MVARVHVQTFSSFLIDDTRFLLVARAYTGCPTYNEHLKHFRWLVGYFSTHDCTTLLKGGATLDA